MVQAVALVAVNAVLARLLESGDTADRLRAAAPALVVVALAALAGALLRAASTAGTGRLEPKVERVATERYLARTAEVELEAAPTTPRVAPGRRAKPGSRRGALSRTSRLRSSGHRPARGEKVHERVNLRPVKDGRTNR